MNKGVVVDRSETIMEKYEKMLVEICLGGNDGDGVAKVGGATNCAKSKVGMP